MLCCAFVFLILGSFCVEGQLLGNGKVECTDATWKCNDGSCIYEALVCDSKDHCSEGEDEDHEMCELRKCPSSKFLCKDGHCIEREFVCDGYSNCFNDDDETHCSEDVCPEDKFRCDSGKCIKNSWRCDRIVDCVDKSDEKDCEGKLPPCDPNFVSCEEGTCVHKDTLCDGVKDCKSGEDEENCFWKTCLMEHGKFKCFHSKHCINRTQLCDGNFGCLDRSDEGEGCDKKCSSIFCTQSCFETPIGPRCTCEEGFKLDKKHLCKDINECDEDMLICTHFCENTNGSHKCSCPEHYQLYNNASCTIDSLFGHASPINFAQIFFILDNRILSRDMASGFLEVRVESDKLINLATYDPTSSQLYWMDVHNKIYSKHIHRETEKSTYLELKGIDQPKAMEMDWFGKNLYILDKNHHVLVCNVVSLACTPILAFKNSPTMMKLDLAKRFLFLGGSNKAAIMRSSMDGTKKKVIVPASEFPIQGLALDPPAERVYWVDLSTQNILTVKYDGAYLKKLESLALEKVSSLSVYNGQLYWTQWDTTRGRHRELMSFPQVHGIKITVIYRSELHQVRGAFINHKSMYRDIKNPCPPENGCSHLCLLSTNKEGYVCACPQEMKLSIDKHLCIDKPQPKIIYSCTEDNKPAFKQILQRHYGKDDIVPIQFKGGPSSLVSDTYCDHRTGLMYIAELKSGVIYKGDLGHLTATEIAYGIEKPISIVIDSIRKNLYWIHGTTKQINVAKLRGSFKKPLKTIMKNPTNLAIDANYPLLFVANKDPRASIWSMNLTAGDATKIIETKISDPTSIVVDPDLKKRKIYWTDNTLNVVERCNYDGSGRETILSNIVEPFQIAVSPKFIYVTTLQGVLATINKIDFDDVGWDLISENIIGEWHTTKFSSLLAVDKITLPIKHVCNDNDGCDQLCFSLEPGKSICDCEHDMVVYNETKCKRAECPEAEVPCEDGTCIPAILWCDGQTECDDGSDERHCENVCNESEFLCDNKCISMTKKCDYKEDCDDKSDESGCSICDENDWKCSNNQCIKSNLICDGDKNCLDGSDEVDCVKKKCAATHFQCTIDGSCIEFSKVCDGTRDCFDGDDEKRCHCILGKFDCGNDTCIDNTLVCDGTKNCQDGSDESGHKCDVISPSANVKCGYNRRACTNSADECIREKDWCNNIVDCSNRADEDHCNFCGENVQCPSDGSCVNKEWVCDGVKDCEDGSDEFYCPKKEDFDYPVNTCPPGSIECYDGRCIKNDQACDGIFDCSQGEDETELCITCDEQRGGCEQLCLEFPNRVVCDCKNGYRLKSDMKTCEKIHFCQESRFVCDQICTDVGDTFECSCNIGYELQKDKKTCLPIDGKVPWMMLYKNDDLNFIDKDLQISQNIKIPKNKNIVKFEYDYSENATYMLDGDRKKILRYSNLFWVFYNAPITPYTFTLDAFDKNLYIAEELSTPAGEFYYTTIKACSLATKMCADIIPSIEGTVRSLIVSRFTDTLIYCVNKKSSSEIHEVELTGGSYKVRINTKLGQCGALALHPITGDIFWIDQKRRIIQSVNKLWGERKTVIAHEIVTGTSLYLMGNNIVWQNEKYGKIRYCPLVSVDKCEYWEEEVNLAGTVNPNHGESIISQCEIMDCAHVCIEVSTTPHCICSESDDSDSKCEEDSLAKESSSQECPKSMCNNGSCIVTDHEIKCRCHEGYSGPTCLLQDNSGMSGVAIALLIIMLVAVIMIGIKLFRKHFLQIRRTIRSPFVNMGIRYNRDSELITTEVYRDQASLSQSMGESTV